MTWLRSALVLLLVGCGPVMSTTDGGGDRPLSTTSLDGGCAITVESWALGAGTHVPVGTEIVWPSNPPSSGAHFPVWAAYQEFTTPVPRGYWVHSLEHGAVALLSNCALVNGDCAPVHEALRQASASVPDDPKCSGVRVRTVITPDPLLTEPVVAVSWGFIYRAQCVDLPSLSAFVKSHYAQGPEDTCAAGVTQF